MKPGDISVGSNTAPAQIDSSSRNKSHTGRDEGPDTFRREGAGCGVLSHALACVDEVFDWQFDVQSVAVAGPSAHGLYGGGCDSCSCE